MTRPDLARLLVGTHQTGATIDAAPRHPKLPNIERQDMTRPNLKPTPARAPGAALTDAIAAATRALGYEDHTPVGAVEPTWTRTKPAAVNARIALRDLLPDLIDPAGRITRAPAVTRGADRLSLLDLAAGYSRVIAAGAQVIALPPEVVADPGPGPAMLVPRPAGMRLVEPAPFAPITLDADGDAGPPVLLPGEGTVAASALPMPEASIARDALGQVAVRFEVTRAIQRDRLPGELEAEIMMALGLGLGRAMDRALLSAVTAATPGAFSAAAVAASGARWSEVRAIIGTNGTGATTDRGEIFAGGVPAEVSPDLAGTLAGSWDRAAVVVSGEADLLLSRIDARGRLVVTAWLGLQGLVPDAGYFWAVA
jgi:hypothetical protein